MAAQKKSIMGFVEETSTKLLLSLFEGQETALGTKQRPTHCHYSAPDYDIFCLIVFIFVFLFAKSKLENVGTKIFQRSKVQSSLYL